MKIIYIIFIMSFVWFIVCWLVVIWMDMLIIWEDKKLRNIEKLCKDQIKGFFCTEQYLEKITIKKQKPYWDYLKQLKLQRQLFIDMSIILRFFQK
ncbi:MAG: hypothetical protein ABH837_00315 [bacterium]